MSDEEGAARVGPNRPAMEDNVAERIKMEREVRGWSTVILAEKMAAAGHSVNQAAIWRIESGKPRRRVNLDEALGFCKVFRITMEDLTSAPSQIANSHVRRLVGEYVEKWVEWRELDTSMTRIRKELDTYGEQNPDQAEMIKSLLTHELEVASGGEFNRHYIGNPQKQRSWMGDISPK
ncbi:helix-turn-helix domain-containing protein [Streptomyces sp. P38-E01]|uniref:Helix-turn-helix domain-containing protein n=1 Tax=Streptomyces tardus TaxID=2780544 RepID=A0A949JF49_9ACTN|nr:helix-turn-helix transcriptional regulator [Streptomyces tardus]MBU7597359.1 helix-turn-helix domain-containing protein [Streptomyces tardus]